jgi:hypothetical protein
VRANAETERKCTGAAAGEGSAWLLHSARLRAPRLANRLARVRRAAMVKERCTQRELALMSRPHSPDGRAKMILAAIRSSSFGNSTDLGARCGILWMWPKRYGTEA